MDLLQLVLILIVIGVLLGLLNYAAPAIKLDGNILKIINVVVIVAVILWLVMLFLGPIPHIMIGAHRG
jgi:hypothetical protein